MTTNIFLKREISKFKKESELSKKDLLRFLELITYLASKEEISIKDAERYATIIFKRLEELKP